METTFAMIKPNGVAGGLVGEIVARYEKARLTLAGIKIKTITKTEAEEFYGEHKGKGFFDGLVSFMTSGPTIILALRGENAVLTVRAMNGATNPKDAAPGTIRFDFATTVGENIVHSSDSIESAKREVGFWFKENELVQYNPYNFKR